jgi:hypothetical protein
LCVNKSQFVPVIFEPPCIIKPSDIPLNLTRNKKTIHELKIREYKFEGISRFTYLGSVLTENYSIIAEINGKKKKKKKKRGKCNIL